MRVNKHIDFNPAFLSGYQPGTVTGNCSIIASNLGYAQSDLTHE
jgi:hypothetical protein